jgi:cytochrome c556
MKQATHKTAGWTISIMATAWLIHLTVPPPVDAQTVETKRVMQQKLAQSQQLLGALVTSNWMALSQRTAALQALTSQPGWQVLTTPEFRDQTAAFQRATQALAAAGNQRDQRTALAAYNQLVTSCVECHRYVARSRIAELR